MMPISLVDLKSLEEFDARCRDVGSAILERNAHIGSLRKTYGEHFAKGRR
jgi:hypothetical protein